MLLQHTSASVAHRHAKITALLLMCLGWGINWEKSCFLPKQAVLHLGFVFNTKSMTISCPPDKVSRLQIQCKNAIKTKVITVHNLERMLGQMESVRPVTPFAALKYRPLQRQLVKAKLHGRKPSKVIIICPKSIAALRWWISPLGFASNCTAPLRT